MPRPPQHELHRYASRHPEDRDDDLLRPYSQIIAHAEQLGSSAHKNAALDAAIEISNIIRESNDAELYQKHSLEPVIIAHLDKMEALERTLKEAGVRQWRTTADAVIAIGFHLHYLPERFGLCSIVSQLRDRCEFAWKHWVEIASVCRIDIVRYPGTYNLVSHNRVLRIRFDGATSMNQYQHEFTFFVDDFLKAMNDNVDRANYLFAEVAENQLTPGQLRKRKSPLMQVFLRQHGIPELPYLFSPDCPAPPATVSDDPDLRYVSLNW